MNLDGSTYSLVETQNLSGTTGSSVTPSVKTYTGFTSPNTQTVTISADGSTVVEYRYARIEYHFDVNSYLDGNNITASTTPTLSGLATYDVYVNGVKVGEDVSDYYAKHYYGSTYTVNDIKAKAGYSISGDTSFTGTICPDVSEEEPVTRVIINFKTNSYTYNIVYKSSSGVQLGTDTLTKVFGTTNTVSPKAFTGYTSPSSQSVVFDSISAKTITFTYTPITYKITYTLNSGSVSGNPTTYTIETATFTLKNPTRTGYTFNGWTGSNGTTKQTSVSIAKGSTGDKSYTANFTANNYTYNIVYKSSSGVQLGTATLTKAFGTTNTVSPKAFTGYTSPANQSVVFDSTSAKTITFTYTPITYTITYTLNSGSVSGNPTTYTIETATITLKNPTRTGYTFAGWTGSNGSTKQTSVSIAKGSTGDKSYTANFTANNYTYNIVYKSSSGVQLGTATLTKAFGTTNTVSPKAFTGYTSPSNQSVVWDSTTAKTITFTYTPTAYTITYTLNSGSVSGNPTTYTIETATFTLKNPTRTGYTFAGWTGSNGTTKQTSVSVAKGSTGNKSYTANWTAHTYKVIYNPNGGYLTGNTPSTLSTTSNNIVSYPFTDTTHTDNNAVTFTDNKNGTITVNGTAASGSAAMFVVGTYSLPAGTYYLTGGTASQGNAFFCSNDVVWKDTGNGCVFTLTATTSVTFKLRIEGVTLTNAVFTPSIVRISNHTYGTSSSLAANQFVKTGYSFAGWSTSATGSVQYANNASVSTLTATNGGTVTLYAIWTISKYTITWKNYDGTVLETDSTAYGQMASYDGKDPTKPSTTNYTYKFKGWDKRVSFVTGATTYTAQYYVYRNSTSTATNKGKINVYLIGGQSNAVGYGLDTNNALANSDSRYTNGFSNVLYYGEQEYWGSGDLDAGFQPVKLGLGFNDTKSGAEIGIASAIADNGEMNAIIKCAYGATHLYPDATANASIKIGTWTPPSYISKYNIDLSKNPLIGQMYYWFEQTVANGLRLLVEAGYTPVIQGMWWMQGEAEMFSAEMSSAYEELLKTLISDVRVFLTKASGTDCSKMPFVCGLPKWNQHRAGGPAYQSAVRNAMMNVANSTSMVSYVDALPLIQYDGWHFQAADQKYLGEHFIYEVEKLKGGLPMGLTLDGNLTDGIWNNVNKNNYYYVNANGAQIKIVGKLLTNGMLFAVRVNHTKAPDVSTDGSGSWHTYLNILFRFNNDTDSTFYYTTMGKQNNNLFKAGHKSVTNGSGYTTTFEIYIPLSSIGAVSNTSSVDFACNGWVESGWSWFYPDNTNWTETHTLTADGIEEKQTILDSMTFDGALTDTVWSSVNKTNNINVSANGATVNVIGTIVNDGVLFGVTVNHTKAATVSTNGGTSWYNYMNIEFRFPGCDSGFIYTCRNAKSSAVFTGYAKTTANGSAYKTIFEIYIPFKSIGVADDTTNIDFTCNGWFESGWCWMFGTSNWNATHTLTYNGIRKIETKDGIKLDGSLSESTWSSISSKNINIYANHANVKILGRTLTNGVVLGITITHNKPVNVSTNGGTSWYHFMNFEIHFNGSSSGFIYSAMGRQNNTSFYANHKTVNNVTHYTTVMEIYIPFSALGLSNGTTSVDFTCSGWFESGWSWFFPANQSWTATHTLTSSGIVKK